MALPDVNSFKLHVLAAHHKGGLGLFHIGQRHVAAQHCPLGELIALLAAVFRGNGHLLVSDGLRIRAAAMRHLNAMAVFPAAASHHIAQVLCILGFELDIQRTIRTRRELDDVCQIFCLERLLCRTADDDRIIFARRQAAEERMVSLTALGRGAKGDGVGGVRFRCDVTVRAVDGCIQKRVIFCAVNADCLPLLFCSIVVNICQTLTFSKRFFPNACHTIRDIDTGQALAVRKCKASNARDSFWNHSLCQFVIETEHCFRNLRNSSREHNLCQVITPVKC